MKILLAFFLLLALVALFLPGPVAASAGPCTTTVCSVSVARVVTVNSWGTTLVNDTISLNATSPVSSLRLGIPTSVAANLRQTTASDAQGKTIQVMPLATNQTGGYQPYRFTFPASEKGHYTFTSRSVFSDLVSFDPSSSKYAFSFSAFPVVDNESGTVSANITLLTHDWPSPVVSPGNHNVTSSKLNLPESGSSQVTPYNATVWRTVFASAGTSQNLFDVLASRTITIRPAGSVGVLDMYNVTNKGKDTANIAFDLPSGSNSIICSDIIGRLDPSNCPFSTLADGTVSLTFSARFGTVKHNSAAVALLQYNLPNNPYVTSNGLSGYTLDFQMLNDVKFTATTLQAKILLPTGTRLGNITGPTAEVSGNQILLRTSPLTPYSNLGFSIAYRLDPFWSSLSPLGWTALAEGMIAAVALVLVTSTQAKVAFGSPIQLITRFVELCDEKSSLRLEGDKLEEDVSRGAVNKYDYRRRRRVIDLRLAEVDRLLSPIREELSEAQPRYADRTKKIERAEAELQQVKTSLADLKNQNRAGRISRELYDQLSSDLLRRKGRAQQSIDNIIIDFREEAR